MMANSWEGKRIVILGAARQGQAAARFLSSNKAIVTINDQRTETELLDAREALQGFPIRWVVGSHPIELLETNDMICLSGGVPITLPLVQEAARRGIPLINDTQVFLEVVPCKTIGISGSAGKTTTTALLGKIAGKAFAGSTKHAWVGGNIGDPLINHINEMKAEDLAIMEISSFQLEQMTRSTDIAVMLNITPNHLDRHKSMQSYIAAKARLIEYQGPKTMTILNRDDPGSWGLKSKVHGELYSFGFSSMEGDSTGMTLSGQKYTYKDAFDAKALFDQSIVHLKGKHNQLNVMAASLTALVADLPIESIITGVDEFQGVGHRLEFVRSWKGADWYNDSIATAPERSLAAIQSFDQPIVLLLGGRDKDLPWENLAEVISERVRLVVLFGEAAEKIETALLNSVQKFQRDSIERCNGLKDAVLTAARLVKPGDVVLFSPGGTSFDEFRDFEERGERFCQWVLELS